MQDIHCLEHKIEDDLLLYMKYIKYINKQLRKNFPKEKQFVHRKHEFEKLCEQLQKDLFKLNCFALGESTMYSMMDIFEEKSNE